LNYRTNKVKEYIAGFDTILSVEKKEKLQKKLKELGLTRLKEEHIVKFVDFLPKNINELKAILAAYPLSLTKKDQDAIVEAVKEFTS
jgi:DNA-directed RNA polymerase subunit F